MGSSLKGKTAIVTGAAQGLGFAIAQRFAQEGAKVYLADLDKDTVVQKAKEIGAGAQGVKLNVTSKEDWDSCFSEIVSSGSTVDILVNNAGIHHLTPFEMLELEEWNRVISVNLDGTFLGCKAAVSHMKDNGGGSIVNIASVAALRGNSHGPAYGASKAAVINFSRSIAVYCGMNKYNIRCNSVLPGMTRTPMMDAAPDEITDQVAANTPTGRIGEPVDIANAVLYFASDAAVQVTGTELIVDGGLVA